MRICSISTILIFIFSIALFAGQTIPSRSISIIVSDDGLYPETIVAYVGEEIDLYVTSVKELPSCLMLKENNFFVAAKKGEISEGRLKFKTAGRYTLHCPSDKFSGKIVVLDRHMSKEAKRKIASKKKTKRPSVWVPKEY